MANSTKLHEKARNRPRYTPARVLGAFIIALVTVAVMTALQSRQRDLLESTEAPTAVGDRAYFVLRRPVIWKVPVAALRDRAPLYLQSDEPVTRADTEMLKVSWWRRYHVYREPASSGTGTGVDQANVYYLKMGKGLYLPLGLDPVEEANPGQ